MENKIYQYYLDQQTKRRLEAKQLFENGEYQKLVNEYIHYIDIIHKEVRILHSDVERFITEVNQIKSKLPKNAFGVYINISSDEGDLFSAYNVLTWRECYLNDYSKCVSLAKSYTKTALYKIKHQPNGKNTKIILDKIKNI